VLAGGLYHRQPGSDQSPFARALRADFGATLAGFVDACVPEPDSAHLKRWGRQILGRAEPDAALALLGLGGDRDLRPELHRIAQPALILHGSADALVPLADAEALAAALPEAEIMEIEGAGHVPTVTRSDEVVRAIRRCFEPR
jgi:pimeloyl-ACP methyl ester carboxylesterase